MPAANTPTAGQFLLWNYATATAGSQAANASGFGGATFSAGTWHHFVYLNDDRAQVTAPTFDNDGFRLFLHEIGHALGLSHPGNYNILPGGASLAYDGNAVYREDTDQYTVMSYFDEAITHANFVDTFAMTPMLHDIAAIQRLYGANNDHARRRHDLWLQLECRQRLVCDRLVEPACGVRGVGWRRQRYARFLGLRRAPDHHARPREVLVGRRPRVQRGDRARHADRKRHRGNGRRHHPRQ